MRVVRSWVGLDWEVWCVKKEGREGRERGKGESEGTHAAHPMRQNRSIHVGVDGCAL